MEGLSGDARAGLIATAVILLMGWALTMATSIRQQKEWGTAYHVIFNRIEGIDEGSKVYYAGRYVGRVRRLEVRPSDQRVDVTIAIRPFEALQLTRESHYRVDGRLFGERWISIRWEPGEPVPPNGEVAGESVPRFTHLLRHGIEALDRLEEQVADFKKQYGNPAVIRRQTLAMIKSYSELSFDVRAQVNNFNKFSGLANHQLDQMAGNMSTAAQTARARLSQMTAQMRLAVVMARRQTASGDRTMHDVLAGMQGRVRAMQGPVEQAGRMLQSARQMQGTIAALRKKTEEYRDLAATLHFFSKNPELAKQIKGGLSNLRQAAHDARMRVPGGTEPPSPAPIPQETPPAPSGTEPQRVAPSPPSPAPSVTPAPAGPAPTPIGE